MRCSLVLVGVLVSGCVVPLATHSDSLNARASFDMRCPVAELRITEIDASTAGVDGCGQRGTYVYSPAVSTWVLNSPGAERQHVLFEARPRVAPDSLAGVPPGAPPGTLPGALPGTLPGAMPGTLPGAMPGTLPGAMPGAMPGAPPGASAGPTHH